VRKIPNNSDEAKLFNEKKKEIEDTLKAITAINDLCNDKTLSEEQMIQKAKPFLEKLAQTNPKISKDFLSSISKGSSAEIKKSLEGQLKH